MEALTADALQAMLADFLVRLNEDRVDPGAITGTLQDDVCRPAPGGIKYFLESRGAAAVGVLCTVALGRYDASMIVPLAFARGEPLLFYVAATVVDDEWRLSSVLALLRQPHLSGGVVHVPT